ncbi:hypothetical protein [Paenibacillus spongiae]|uniref:Copper amine oxidase N-terminal domain-containing protein n=1 Tax=Paenibacillus spongiae TaxID=2909671 RepID=A0ABY5S5L1_9BACL|nr:hypothetical protein [Paenibacillus spongiae]UVI29196.1 hypothetical protein L1F29_27795 [Paenibacillus spongiae]
MRRIIAVMLVCAGLLVSGVLPVNWSYAKSFDSADLPIAAGDAAVFYLVPHRLTAALNKPSLTLDSVTMKAAPLLKKNGHLYFPLKWLETVHLGSVKWDAKTGSAWAELNPENQGYLLSFHLIPNRSKIYVESNGSLVALEETIPTTFAKDGLLYAPVTLLSRIGVNYSWSKGVMRWEWNDKAIKVLRPTYTTQGDTITFSALAQKEFGHVYLLQSLGIGGMTSVIGGGISSITGTEKMIGGPILVNGKEFRRMEYTVDLRPGANPIQIYSNVSRPAGIVVHRQVSDPSSVSILYNHPENERSISFDKPTQGYLRIQSGEPIAIAGTVTDSYIQSNEVAFQVSIFRNDDYYEIGERTVVPLDENKGFSGSVVMDKPGTYLVNILSPAVFVGGSSPYGSVKWAEIQVEVLPKGENP